MDKEQFQNPPANHRVVQYVQGNKINIDQMVQMHLGGGVCGVSWGDDYLKNESSWETLTDDLKRAKQAGLVTWIFDEKGYPSGCAGGLTVKDHPEWEAKGIYLHTTEGNGKSSSVIGLPQGALRFISAYLFPKGDVSQDPVEMRVLPVTDTQIQVEGMDGDWVVYAVAEKIMFEGSHAYLMMKTWKATGHYPNLMDRDAVRKFIEITHEAYRQRIGDFGDDIYAFYTNEPSLMTHWVENADPRPNGECYAPWEKTIPDRFFEKFGVDLLTQLYKVFIGEDESSKILRYQYYTIVGDLMTQNFSGQLADWCESHHTRLSGHILCEEYMAQHVPLFGDFFRVIGRFSVPGADMAIRPHGKDRTIDVIGLKYVSSAARMYGKQKVQTLMDPILGGYFKDNVCQIIPLDVLINNLNLLYFCGINVITTYGSWEQHPVADYRLYNQYAGRLSVSLGDAVDKSNTALYYPIETFQGRYIPSSKYIHTEHFDYTDIENPQIEIVRRLVAANIDFNYIHPEAILESKIEDSVLKMNNHRYTSLIVPAAQIMEYSVAKKLRDWIDQGGVVIFAESVPDIAGKMQDSNKLRELFSGCHAVKDYDRMIATILTVSDNEAVCESDTIQMARYQRCTKRLLFVMNPTDTKQTGIIRVKGVEKSTVCNPENGEISEQKLPLEITLDASRSLIIEYEPIE